MKKINKPAVIVFAAALITAAVTFNLEMMTAFFIALAVTIVSAVVLAAVSVKSGKAE